MELSDASLLALAERCGGPLFVYQPATARARIEAVRRAFEGAPLSIRYAVKANPHPDLLAALSPWVDGLDVSSLGELELARSAGYDPRRLQLSGPAKSAEVLRAAAEAGAQLSVEHPQELPELRGLGLPRAPRLVLRLQPAAPLSAYGLSMQPRFGLDAAELELALEQLAAAGPALELVGLHFFAGSQCRSAAAILKSWLSHLDASEALLQRGLEISELNLGGGFGVPEHPSEAPLELSRLGKKATRAFTRFRQATGAPLRFTLELGRYLVAEAGVYLARVVRVKAREAGPLVFLEGGINHLLMASDQLGPRPRRLPRVRRLGPPSGAPIEQRLAGPLCTPLDDFGRVRLPPLSPGDWVCFEGAGAYGLSFSPWQALGHARPRELLIDAQGEAIASGVDG